MTEQELKTLLSDHDYAACWDELQPTLSREIRLTPIPVKQDDFRLGGSKQGGKPDLPSFESWPKYKIRNSPGVRNTSKPMTFLMQLNCSDIRPLLPNVPFPETGLLSFFVGIEQNHLVLDTNENPVGQVFYSDFQQSDPKRFEFPRGLYYLNRLLPAGLKMELSVSVSEGILIEFIERYHDFHSDSLNEEIQSFYQQEIRQPECHKIFGYPTEWNLDIFDECSRLRSDMEKGSSHSSEWILLLEFHLGELSVTDSGLLYFLIHRDDLEMQRFQNVVCLHDTDN